MSAASRAKATGWLNIVKEETECHFPYAIFSVVLSMILLSFFSFSREGLDHVYAHRLFHIFHFLHLLFAATGVVLMFRRYSKNIAAMIFVGVLVPAVFCSLSDAIIPYLGGQLLRADMVFHWCFLQHKTTVSIFLSMGIINGWLMSRRPSGNQMFYSASSHFAHIFISSMASMLYMVGYGITDWWGMTGAIFLFLIVAVLIPCTLSDIVVPVLFASRMPKVNEDMVHGGCSDKHC